MGGNNYTCKNHNRKPEKRRKSVIKKENYGNTKALTFLLIFVTNRNFAFIYLFQQIPEIKSLKELSEESPEGKKGKETIGSDIRACFELFFSNKT